MIYLPSTGAMAHFSALQLHFFDVYFCRHWVVLLSCHHLLDSILDGATGAQSNMMLKLNFKVISLDFVNPRKSLILKQYF